MKKYTYPNPRTVSQANSILIVQFNLDFFQEKLVLQYREVNEFDETVSSPIVQFSDLEKADLFINSAGVLPGDTFESKLLTPQALQQILPFVPFGGVIEDV